MRSPILCLPFQGESLKTILSSLSPEVENVLLCGPAPASQSELVDWVYNPAVMDDYHDGGTYLGQEEDQAPTIALARGERSIRLRFASTWFDEEMRSTAAEVAFAKADGLIRQKFKIEDANFASPVALGRHLMAACWRYDKLQTPAAPPEIRELLTSIGPQGRHELLTLPELETIPALYGYDMRLAYLWCCKGLPFGEMRMSMPRKAHKVQVQWDAPDGWAHIGLLPERRQGWRYPLRGEGWVDEREWSLATRNEWEMSHTGALSWSSEGALDRWADGLQWCLRQSKEDRVVYRLFRRVALNSIGSLHRSSVRRSRALPAHGREKPPTGNPSLRLSADGGTYFWQEETPLNPRALIYCHPEWTSTIWARCRARLAQAALQFPREQVIAMRQDALFVSEPHPTWRDDGAVGRFRLKETVPGPIPAPHSLEALQELRMAGDGG